MPKRWESWSIHPPAKNGWGECENKIILCLGMPAFDSPIATPRDRFGTDALGAKSRQAEFGVGSSEVAENLNGEATYLD